MSQFAFLEAEFPDIFAHAARAENFAYSDPRAAAFYGRPTLEAAAASFLPKAAAQTVAFCTGNLDCPF
jgi:hypothetical protein